MKPTRDPVTGAPAVEICNNLVILKEHVRPEDIGDATTDDIQTILTPSDRGRINSA